MLLLLLLLVPFHVRVVEGMQDVGVEQGLPHFDESQLQLIQVIVQAVFENVIHAAKFNLGEQTAGELLRLIGEAPLRHAGNAPQRAVEASHAVFD